MIASSNRGQPVADFCYDINTWPPRAMRPSGGPAATRALSPAAAVAARPGDPPGGATAAAAWTNTVLAGTAPDAPDAATPGARGAQADALAAAPAR